MKTYPKDFEHIEQEIKSIEDHIKLAEELAKKHNGILPGSSWLVKKGYGSLFNCIIKHSKYFKHIEKNKLAKNIEEHTKIAEELAKENNGILPNTPRLIKNGYVNLCRCIRVYPGKFRHIKQGYKGGEVSNIRSF